MSTSCPGDEEIATLDLTYSMVDIITHFVQFMWAIPADEGYRVLLGIEQDGDGVSGYTDDENEMVCHFLEYSGRNWTTRLDACKDDIKVPAKVCFSQPAGM